MFRCNTCGSYYANYHVCPGYVVVRQPDTCEPEQEPGYGDIPSRILWNVRQLRKEIAELRGDRRDREYLTRHWGEHD